VPLRADACSVLGSFLTSPMPRWYGILVDDDGKVVWQSSPSYRSYGRHKGEDRALRAAQVELERRKPNAMTQPPLKRKRCKRPGCLPISLSTSGRTRNKQ
jgi:hypothetical protein